MAETPPVHNSGRKCFHISQNRRTCGCKSRYNFKQGIDKDLGKKITKDIKDTKLKVQPQFMENKIRVSGKKIDDLQAVIAKLKENDYGIALQFNNFRS